jgi:hypothetical protein
MSVFHFSIMKRFDQSVPYWQRMIAWTNNYLINELIEFNSVKLFLIIRNSHPAIMIRYGRGFACSPAHIRRSVMVSSW